MGVYRWGLDTAIVICGAALVPDLSEVRLDLDEEGADLKRNLRNMKKM